MAFKIQISRHHHFHLVEFGFRVREMMVNFMYCSGFSLEQSESITGTAPSWDRIVVFTLGSPWSSKIELSRYFPENVRLLMDNKDAMERLRIQCIVPDDRYVKPGFSKLLYYQKSTNEGYFNGYNKSEFDVPIHDLNLMIPDLINGNLSKALLPSDSETRDLFICTHGSRDACCASFGFVIYEKLRKMLLDNSRIRVWRVSHLGGHRFAPNMLDMPQGRMWARLTENEAFKVVESTMDLAIINKCYRGLIGIDSSFEQVLEKELFGYYGSDWIEKNLKTAIVSESENNEYASVNLVTNDRNSKKSSYSAKVSVTGYLPTPDCMSDNFSDEFSPQYSIGSIDWQ